MKNIIILFLITSLFATSCSKEEIQTFDGDNTFLFFEYNSLKDSTITTFKVYKEEEISIFINIKASGSLVEQSIAFNIEVDKEATTLPAEYFDLPSQPVFHKGGAEDMLEIKLRNYKELDNQTKSLVINITPGNGYKVGPLAYSKSKIYISNMLIAPKWWTELDNAGLANIAEQYFLGKYSEKKHLLLLEVLDGVLLDGYDRGQLRYYAIKLKNHVEQWNEEHYPEVMMDEENNEPMTIPVAG